MTNREYAPRICVIIPAYNAAATLPRTLDSLIDQDSESWTAVAVDDGSSDRTAEVAVGYATRYSRIRTFSQSNAGTAAARNAAAGASEGEFISLLDADDYLLPNYVSTMSAFIEDHPGYDIYSCNVWLEYEDGSRRLYVQAHDSRPHASMSFRDYLLGGSYLCMLGAIVRRTTFDRLGGFRSGYYAEDVDFWRRALASGAKHIFCPEPLAVYDKGVQGQKTEDRARIIESYIVTDEDLLGTGLLGEEDTELLRGVLDRNRYRLEHGGTPDELAARRTEAQAQALRSRVARVFGEKRADAVLKLLRPITSAIRPLRLALNRALAPGKQVRR